MKWKVYKTFDDFSPRHLYDILKLRQDIFIIEQNCIYNDIDGLDAYSEHLLLLEPDEIIIGYLRIVPAGIKFKEGSLGRIVIEKSNRGKGLGKNLVEKGIQILSENGSSTVRIEAQAHLEIFYKNIGFTTISEVYEIDEIPHLQMIFAI